MKILMHVSASATSAGIKISEIRSHRYLWFGANDTETFIHEADTLEELGVQAGIEEWGIDWDIDWLITRMAGTEVDCDSAYGEAFYIEGKCIAISDSLTVIES